MKTSQHKRIAAYIAEHGSITQAEANNELGITKLATRISEMRRSGYAVNVSIERGVNRFGEPCRFARYSKAEG